MSTSCAFFNDCIQTNVWVFLLLLLHSQLWGSPFLVRFLCMWLVFSPYHRGSYILSYLHEWCFMLWNACVHRLDLGLLHSYRQNLTHNGDQRYSWGTQKKKEIIFCVMFVLELKSASAGRSVMFNIRNCLFRSLTSPESHSNIEVCQNNIFVFCFNDRVRTHVVKLLEGLTLTLSKRTAVSLCFVACFVAGSGSV